MKRSVTIFAAPVLALALAACGGDGSPVSRPASTPASSPGTQSGPAVSIAMFTFTPATLTVAAGTTVTWTNTDQILHTATAGSGPDDKTGVFDGQMSDAGTTFAFTFQEAGTYPYFCDRHPGVPGMHGTIVVT